MSFNFGWIPLIQQELRRFFASTAQGALADSALQPANIGSSVQAYDADLAALAALNTTGAIERTGAGTAATYTVTAYGKSLVAAANASEGRGVLGVTIGSNVQAWNTNLDAIAGLGTTGLLERTGPGTYTTYSQLPTAKLADASVTIAKLAAAVQNNLLPPGAVVQVAASTAPSGFLKANGATVSRTTYADLFAAIGTTFGAGDGSTTFTLPDLRGEFLRSWDDGRGVDPSRAIGTAQVATSIPAGGINSSSDGTWTRPVVIVANPDPTVTDAGQRLLIANSQTTTEAFSYTQSTVRPRNVALLTCIKF